MASTTGLGVYHAIYGRRSAWKFADRPVHPMAVERMLDAAIWAPNHRMTEPWRFFVLEQESPERNKAAALAAEFQLERTGDQRRADAARQKVLDPPVVIYVYTVPGPDDETTKENYASVCIAAHNISLAGVAEELAVTWETGGVIRHPGLAELLGADDSWQMTAMLLIGHPGERPVARLGVCTLVWPGGQISLAGQDSRPFSGRLRPGWEQHLRCAPGPLLADAPGHSRTGKPSGLPHRSPLQGRSDRRRSGAQFLSSETPPTNSSNGTAHRGVGRPGEATPDGPVFPPSAIGPSGGFPLILANRVGVDTASRISDLIHCQDSTVPTPLDVST